MNTTGALVNLNGMTRNPKDP